MASGVERMSGRRSVAQSLGELFRSKIATLALAVLAICLGLATFAVLSGGMSLANRPHAQLWLMVSNLVVLLLLGAMLAGRFGGVLAERRRGTAGARLHVRLVVLFSIVAVIPAIVVAAFATVFFHLGIELWFNDRVRTALNEAVQASTGYLQEHNNNIRADALAMADQLGQAGRFIFGNPDALEQALTNQTVLRGLTEAVIYDPVTSQVVAYAGLGSAMAVKVPPASVANMARTGDVAILDSPDETSVRAVVALDSDASLPSLMLMIVRPVDRSILDHMHRTQHVVADYDRLDHHRSGLQLTFGMIFVMVTLLVLSSAVLIGLLLANQIARPVGLLILAAERVRTGDLGVRVPERESDDEVAGLLRAFNRMTDQLAAQRAELMSAYGQINERRRFTESVLLGVSAGVVGLDSNQRIELPNRVASDLLGQDLDLAIGRGLVELAPDFAPLLAIAAQQPERVHTEEVQTGAASARRTLLVRVSPENKSGLVSGYVVTFDDITELQSAQRKAAWADVARRIAHEIKNPLTPIQLSAERLKRRFLREISSDPDTFSQCADTIVRHVGDIGRMVDEFSAFARMPQPLLKLEDVGRVAREALILQRNARPEITWETDIPARGPMGVCDRRLLGQALTNLLQNAADAIAGRVEAAGPPPAGPHGTVWIAVREEAGTILLSVADDGMGLPAEDQSRLTEPYVTHKPKGTGLGLAIVKKIMEDHGGAIRLEDRAGAAGALAVLILPTKVADAA